MPAHAVRVPAGGVQKSQPQLELPRAQRRGTLGSDRGRSIEPRLRLLDLAQLEVGEGGTAGGEELELPVTDRTCALGCLGAPRQREVGDRLRPGEHVDAVEHLYLGERALTLAREGRELRREPSDLLDVA